MKSRSNSSMRRLAKISIYGLLAAFSLIAIFPMYFVVTASLKTTAEYSESKIAFPREVTWDNYNHAVVQADLARYLINTAIAVPIGVVLYLFVCSSAGFAFGRLRFKYRFALFSAVLFLMIFPQMVISIPVYSMAVSLGLSNSFAGVILVWVAYFAPFGTYIMTTYYSTVPRSLLESARIDGASVYQILARIMIPVAMPMIATIAIIGFQAMWNELPFSLLFLQKRELRTLTLGIAMMKGEHGLPVPIVSAGLAFSMLVPLLLFLFFQRYIAGGATAGAVKG